MRYAARMNRRAQSTFNQLLFQLFIGGLQKLDLSRQLRHLDDLALFFFYIFGKRINFTFKLLDDETGITRNLRRLDSRLQALVFLLQLFNLLGVLGAQFFAFSRRPGFQSLVFFLKIIDDRAQRVAAVCICILKR